jgi:hypothetical protein
LRLLIASTCPPENPRLCEIIAASFSAMAFGSSGGSFRISAIRSSIASPGRCGKVDLEWLGYLLTRALPQAWPDSGAHSCILVLWI